MDGLQVQWGDVIRAAAQNPLGIVALIVLGLMVVAVIFFRTAPVGVKAGVFAGLLACGGTLVGVMLHEKGDLQQNVDVANGIVKAATSIKSLAESPDTEASSRKPELVAMDAVSLATLLDSTPALRASPTAASAQGKLLAHRTSMLARRDPATGAVRTPPEPLDPETRAAAIDLASSVLDQLRGKNALEVRALLRGQPGR